LAHFAIAFSQYCCTHDDFTHCVHELAALSHAPLGSPPLDELATVTLSFEPIAPPLPPAPVALAGAVAPAPSSLRKTVMVEVHANAGATARARQTIGRTAPC
jgi:hypothetical protein